MENIEVFENRIDLSGLNLSVEAIRNTIGNIVIGQDKLIDYLLIAILADGHVLLEGVPGVAKTLSAKLTAKCISADFSRIQFTPDLMPSDVVGTTIFNMHKSEFEFNAGPVFSNIILIDEINRAPAKTQSALFEVMEERQVTVDGTTYAMDKPFIVFATQNPIDQEGTYRLPEAQLDRFLFKVNVGYPSVEEEIKILENNHNRKGMPELAGVEPVLSVEQIADYQQKTKLVHIDENLMMYIAKIVNKTRNNNSLYLGASPRASIAVMTAAKALAAISGRDFITPEDIKEVIYPVLNHRLMLTPEKEMEGISVSEVIKNIVDSIEIPR